MRFRSGLVGLCLVLTACGTPAQPDVPTAVMSSEVVPSADAQQADAYPEPMGYPIPTSAVTPTATLVPTAATSTAVPPTEEEGAGATVDASPTAQNVTQSASPTPRDTMTLPASEETSERGVATVAPVPTLASSYGRPKGLPEGDPDYVFPPKGGVLVITVACQLLPIEPGEILWLQNGNWDTSLPFWTGLVGDTILVRNEYILDFPGTFTYGPNNQRAFILTGHCTRSDMIDMLVAQYGGTVLWEDER